MLAGAKEVFVSVNLSMMTALTSGAVYCVVSIASACFLGMMGLTCTVIYELACVILNLADGDAGRTYGATWAAFADKDTLVLVAAAIISKYSPASKGTTNATFGSMYDELLAMVT